ASPAEKQVTTAELHACETPTVRHRPRVVNETAHRRMRSLRAMGVSRIDPQAFVPSPPPRPAPVRHFHTATGECRAGTRRQFLWGAGITAGALVASAAFRPGFAFAANDPLQPRPIPGGFRGEDVGDTGNRH